MPATPERVVKRFLRDNVDEIRLLADRYEYLSFLQETEDLFARWLKTTSYGIQSPGYYYQNLDVRLMYIYPNYHYPIHEDMSFHKSSYHRLMHGWATSDVACFTTYRWDKPVSENKSWLDVAEDAMLANNFKVSRIQGSYHVNRYTKRSLPRSQWKLLVDVTHERDETSYARDPLPKNKAVTRKFGVKKSYQAERGRFARLEEDGPKQLCIDEEYLFVSGNQTGKASRYRHVFELAIEIGHEFDQDSILFKRYGDPQWYLIGTTKRQLAVEEDADDEPLWPAYNEVGTVSQYVKKVQDLELSHYKTLYPQIGKRDFQFPPEPEVD